MNSTRKYLVRNVLGLLVVAAFLTSCARSLYHTGSDSDLPPILAQDEIIRPYTKLGRIQIAIESYIAKPDNIQEWGFRALREEAAKMGADAVMLPEVTARPTTYLIVPSNEYRATGVAIKFK